MVASPAFTDDIDVAGQCGRGNADDAASPCFIEHTKESVSC